LRDRFIVGASSDDSGVAKTHITGSLTQTGGSKDAITVSHTHTATSVVTDPGHAHSIIIGEGFSVGNSVQYTNSVVGTRNVINSNTTGITVATTNASTGSSGTNANLVPYYALAFIMKA